MTDIASLGVEVDTREADSGARDLDRLATAAQRTQRQVDSLRSTTEGSNRAQAEANTIARRAAAALGERTTSSESLLRAELALARALQARAQADVRILSTSQAVTEAELRAAAAVATLARQRTESARIALLEFTAMERAASAQESASAAAAELSSRYDLLSSKFTEGYREARQMDAALEDLAEAERLGVQITTGASAAIDQIILKYDARARAAAELRAELDRLRVAEQLEATSSAGQARFGPSAGSGKSASESAALFSMMMDEELSATSASAQAYYNRILGIQDQVENSARESASAFEEEARKMEDLNRAAARLRANIDPLGTAQDRYNREIREYNMLAGQGVISARELGQAHAMAASRLQNYNAVMNGGMESTAMGRQANLANVVAQFQDIGVTAQMGMNPLVIALQQGTQLTQAFVQMENPIKGIGQALLAMISPLSLLTIAMVGLAAVGLQFVDWPTVGAVALNAFADALEATAPYVVGLAAVLALIYAPAVVGGIVGLVALIARVGVAALITGGQMLAGWLMAMGPLGAIIAGVALIVTALVLFRDEIAQIFGRDIVQDIQNAANYIIGSFVGAFEGIKATWSMLPAAIGDLVTQAANNTISGVESMINFVGDRINEFIRNINSAIMLVPEQFRAGWTGLGEIGDVTFGRVHNDNEGAAGRVTDQIGSAMAAAQAYDYVGAAITGVQHVASGAADAIRGLAGSLGASSEESEKAAKAAEKARKAYADIIRDGHQFIAEKQLEAAALGMTEQAANALRYEQEMLNKAANDNINLTPAQRSELSALAKEMAAVEERTRSLTEWYNIGKSAFVSFIGDIKSGIQAGQEAVSSLYNDLYSKISGSDKGAAFTASVEALRVSIEQGNPAFDEFKRNIDAVVATDPSGLQAMGRELTNMADKAKEASDGWSILANAASKALDSIADKALGMAAEGIFDLIFGAIMGGVSGGFGGNPMSLGAGGPGFLGGGASSWGSFSSGGYTGDSPANRAAGIVHGKEYVLNAQATRQIGISNLNAMNAGRMPVSNDNSSGDIVISVTVNGARGNAEVRQMVAEGVTAGLKAYDDNLSASVADKQRRAAKGTTGVGF